jgi:hypothetical protein
MTWTDTLLRLTETLLVPLLGYGAYVLRGIRNELRSLNGRLIHMEAWRDQHDKQDDDRHHDLLRRLG